VYMSRDSFVHMPDENKRLKRRQEIKGRKIFFSQLYRNSKLRKKAS